MRVVYRSSTEACSARGQARASARSPSATSVIPPRDITDMRQISRGDGVGKEPVSWMVGWWDDCGELVGWIVGWLETASGGRCFPRPFNSRAHPPTNQLTAFTRSHPPTNPLTASSRLQHDLLAVLQLVVEDFVALGRLIEG